jgi:hypothetical protein
MSSAGPGYDVEHNGAEKGEFRSPKSKSLGTRWEASCNMRALMTNQKRPKVSNESGKVKILRERTEGLR